VIDSELQVVSPATTADLTLLATAREELGIADGESDVMLARWIHEASAQVADYLHRDLAQETLKETFRSSRASVWGHLLILQRRPIDSVSSVTEDGETVDPAEYTIDQEAGMLRRLSSGGDIRQWRGETIVATYVAGYDLIGDLSRSVEQACLIILRHRWAARRRDPMLRTQDVTGVISQSWWIGGNPGDDPAMPPEAAALLDRHRDLQV
jgi:hypothetical protein